METLKRRAVAIRAEVKANVCPADLEFLSKGRKSGQKPRTELIPELCNQVPVLRFNSGSYDLKLIKKYFVEHLATHSSVKLSKKKPQNHVSAIQRVEVPRHLELHRPGSKLRKWIKAYGCTQEKSWFLYEWFDSPAKLDYSSLPPFKAWYSKLRKAYLLTREEWATCQQTFHALGMIMFKD